MNTWNLPPGVTTNDPYINPRKDEPQECQVSDPDPVGRCHETATHYIESTRNADELVACAKHAEKFKGPSWDVYPIRG